MKVSLAVKTQVPLATSSQRHANGLDLTLLFPKTRTPKSYPKPTSSCVKVRLATFSQHHVDGLDLALTPLQALMRYFPGVKDEPIRCAHGRG